MKLYRDYNNLEATLPAPNLNYVDPDHDYFFLMALEANHDFGSGERFVGMMYQLRLYGEALS